MPSGVIDRLVLDTSAYSRLRAGHERAIEVAAGAAVILLPAIVLGELEAGFNLGSRASENRRYLAEFLDAPFVQTLDITRSVAHRYGQTFAVLREAGTPMSTNDVWIAASTIDCGGTLATFDRDFDRIAGLPLIVLT
jgi:tRNA(fMet)-specific endonuclease VapC